MKKMYRRLILIMFLINVMGYACIAQTMRNAGTYSELVTAVTNSAASGDFINITKNIVVTSEVVISNKSITIIGNGNTISVPIPGLNDMGGYNVSPSGFRILSIGGTSNVTINNITIKGGYLSAGSGGAINNDATLTLNSCILSNSRAANAGAIVNSGMLYMNNVYMLKNGANYAGGLFNTETGTTYIESSTFVENRSTYVAGGGGAIENTGLMYINNSTVSNNQSTEIGSAINNRFGTLYFINSSATGNVSYGNQYTTGAIGNNNGVVMIVNSILAYNYHRTTGDVDNPTGYVLDDIGGSGIFGFDGYPYGINIYYSIYQADLPAGLGTNTSNIQYTGNANGSDNTIFAGGISAPIISTTGSQIGDPVFRPFLFNQQGSLAPVLQVSGFAVNPVNRGTRTRFANNNNVNPAIAYYNGSDYVDIIGASIVGQEVLVDQFGDARPNPPCRGSIERTMDNLYIVRILAAAHGQVNGGTFYADVYEANETATLTAIPDPGYSFVRYDYVLGGVGVASTSSTYSFTVNNNITLQPVFALSPVNNFNIVYIGNGNTGGSAPASTTHSSSTTIANQGTLTKTGYDFVNWNTNPLGFGTSYNAGSTYNPSPAANLILYAQYTEATCTWTGNANSDWNDAANWSTSTVPTAVLHAYIPSVSNMPIIDPSTSATCYNIDMEAGTTLTILSDATGDGSLIVKGSVLGSGTFNVERYLSASQWHLVSSPITAGTAGVFLDIWLRAYNESTNSFGNYITPVGSPMPSGKGYSVWADDAQTRTFSGTINNGSVGPLSVQLTGAAGPNKGWNLMGNPFPSAIDWNASYGWTKTNLANAVYVWNNNQYASYVGNVGTNGGSRYIASEQGFFVQAISSGASLGMANGICVHNGVNFLKETSEPLNIIRISISGNGYSDEAVIAIRESNTSAYDPETDAVKFPGSSSAPQMYTTKSDLSQLAINSLNNVNDVLGKTIYVDYAQYGQHTISWSHTLQGTTIPVLYDNLTATAIQPETPYTFTASSTDPAERFTFAEIILDLENQLANVNVWENNNILYVQNLTNSPVKNISVYNMQGQLVMQFTDNAKDLSNLASAIYIVKVNVGQNTVVEKITVK